MVAEIVEKFVLQFAVGVIADLKLRGYRPAHFQAQVLAGLGAMAEINTIKTVPGRIIVRYIGIFGAFALRPLQRPFDGALVLAYENADFAGMGQITRVIYPKRVFHLRTVVRG